MDDRFVTSPLRERALEILHAHWRPDAGYCVPNPATYPHQWLWDSAFHAVAWARLGDERGVVGAQLAAGRPAGLRDGAAHALRPGAAVRLAGAAGVGVVDHPAADVRARRRRAGAVRVRGARRRSSLRATRALRWLLDTRRDSSGLIFIVHPWEAGNDHAPRWDGWGVPGTTPDTYDQAARSQWNIDLMRDVVIGADGAAAGSCSVRGLPGGVQRLRRVQRPGAGRHLGRSALLREADELAGLIDELLWDEDTNLWADRPVVGGDGRTPPDPDLRRGHAAAGVRPTASTRSGRWGRSSIRRSSAAPRSGRPTSPGTSPAMTRGRTGGARRGPT